MLMLDHITVSP